MNIDKRDTKEYVMVCNDCGSEEVATLQWINTNTGEPYDGDPGVYTEWCFNCNTQTKIVEKSYERRLD